MRGLLLQDKEAVAAPAGEEEEEEGLPAVLAGRMQEVLGRARQLHAQQGASDPAAASARAAGPGGKQQQDGAKG